MHKRCTGLKGRLSDMPNFKSNKCLQLLERNDAPNIKLGNVEYETVDDFCYLGDMLRINGGAEASSITQVRIGWKKFRELLPPLTSSVFLHKLKRKICEACAKNAMLYCRKTGL